MSDINCFGGSTSRRRMNWRHFALIALLTASLLAFCEFFIYYLVLGFHCGYPSFNDPSREEPAEGNPLKAWFIADTHLLGSRNGHWFDKLRREWQMHRAFQTSMTLFPPDVVFFLGDLFDEGKWSSPREFNDTLARFRSLFYVPPKTTRIYAVAGNHDIGFHFATHPYLNQRFENELTSSQSVQKLVLKGNTFVLVNSMAMDRTDECFLCAKGEKELKKVSLKLKNQTSPVLLTHFPLFRISDSDCDEPDDAGEDKDEPFREGYDCISESSTEYLLNLVKPRLILTGHTHAGCQTEREGGIPEITVSSFSWRNRNNPAFIVAQITPDEFALDKCYLPKEDVVINFYCLGITLILIYIIFSRRRFYYHYRRR